MSTGTVLLIIGGILIAAWVYAEVRRARRKMKKGRALHPNPNARREGDSDDSGKQMRRLSIMDFVQNENPAE